VGAGAGGGIVANELARAGLSVVLLERGRWHTAHDCRKDDLRNQRTTVLGVPFGPDARSPRVVVDSKGRAQTVVPVPSQAGYHNNAACVGGGTLSYGAMAWRYMEQDFRMRSLYGAPEGSTLEDWPIAYADLEPFYEKAEWEIGVSGDEGPNPFKGPRKKALPMPPLPPSREHTILKAAALRLGLHPFDIPMLRNTVPYAGRPPCMRCRWCVGFACEVDAKCGTQNTVIPKALATGLCELRTECVAKEVLLDDRGRARGVAYFDPSDRLQEQPASLIVVSGGAIESARLLLNSRNKLFPEGLGNRHDWVGRNYQGHPYPGAIGLFDEEVYDDLGPGASIAVCDFNHGNDGLRGGGALCNEFIRLPVQFLGRLAPGVPRWGKGHKDFMRRYYRRSIAVQGPVQEMPMFEARIQLDATVKDHWGQPVARISGPGHPHTEQISAFMASKAESWLKEAGAVRTWQRLPRASLTGGQHQAGTCRMGPDPKTSVVDRHCRIHDTDNVFVVDASVHVTNGGFNPVLTVMAIAYWASDFMAREWRRGGLR
jgi:choline dehydrogenase-like flavoprotein